MKTNRLLLGMSFACVFLIGPSLYGQQDVDPTWYPCPDPGPSKVTTPAQVAKHVNHPKTVSALPERQTGEPHAKRLVRQEAGSRIAGGDRITVSPEPRLSTRNVRPPMMALDEQTVYPVSPVDGRGAVPAPRMVDETAIPIRD
ncbi:MAG TPA: hypothetical protein VFF64_23475 [Candidatus Eremiobacteraceae bacterium]|nr:hypothetical protein [Candidatus Eremiobacteraceae bacterium]